VRVTEDTMGIWGAWNDLCLTTTNTFTNGEATTPPLGTGSFQVTGVDEAGGALFTQAYDGLTVSQVTTLRYSTKSQHVTDHPYIYINLDTGGDPAADTTIYFFPANNAAQGPSAADVWQTWDGRDGVWNEGGDTGPGAAVALSSFDTAIIRGVRIASGCGGPTDGEPRSRNTDDVEIGVDGATATVFDFERN
jgi:hypothetical protein